MEMVSVQMAQKLMERGHRVTFLTAKGSPSEQALRGSGIFSLPISIRGYVDPWSVKRIRRWIREEGVDLVHAHYSKDLWALVPALSMGGKKVPLVLTKHIGTMKSKRDLLHRWIYRRVDYIIGISKLIQQNVIRTHPIEPERVGCIPNGVDLRAFDVEGTDRTAVRAALGIPGDALVVGMIGRLCWWKGYREFLEMAESLIKVEAGVRFLAVGGATLGEEEEVEEIRSLARSLHLDGKVVFTGFRKDVARLLSAMDLFVYPAYAEAFGLVLIEAMAMGLPVISSDCDGVPEIVVDGKTGILVPPRNSGALTEAVLRMLKDSQKMRAYGRAGRVRVLGVYDFEKVVSRTEELYRDLIQKRKKL